MVDNFFLFSWNTKMSETNVFMSLIYAETCKQIAADLMFMFLSVKTTIRNNEWMKKAIWVKFT